MALLVGQPAPDFKLFSSEKKEVSLAEQRGRNVVLLFFPLAFTSVCTAELCSVRDSIGDYNNMDANVFGISVDSPQTLERFKQEQGLNFTLLSDFNKEASRAYDSIYETFAMGMKGVSKRAAFVIDREGVIKYAEVLENAGEQPNFDEIRKTLVELH